jgi:hypothetical protein
VACPPARHRPRERSPLRISGKIQQAAAAVEVAAAVQASLESARATSRCNPTAPAPPNSRLMSAAADQPPSPLSSHTLSAADRLFARHCPGSLRPSRLFAQAPPVDRVAAPAAALNHRRDASFRHHVVHGACQPPGSPAPSAPQICCNPIATDGQSVVTMLHHLQAQQGCQETPPVMLAGPHWSPAGLQSVGPDHVHVRPLHPAPAPKRTLICKVH